MQMLWLMLLHMSVLLITLMWQILNLSQRSKKEKTCYANAIAAVYHLAMHRIVDREGGVPEFKDILQNVAILDIKIGAILNL